LGLVRLAKKDSEDQSNPLCLLGQECASREAIIYKKGKGELGSKTEKRLCVLGKKKETVGMGVQVFRDRQKLEMKKKETKTSYIPREKEFTTIARRRENGSRCANKLPDSKQRK